MIGERSVIEAERYVIYFHRVFERRPKKMMLKMCL